MSAKTFPLWALLVGSAAIAASQDAVLKRSRSKGDSTFRLDLKTARWVQSIRPLPAIDMADSLGLGAVPRIDSSACSNLLRTVTSTRQVSGYPRYSSYFRPLAEGVVLTPESEIIFWRAERRFGMNFTTVSNTTFGVWSMTNVIASVERWDPPLGELEVPKAGKILRIELNPRWKAFTRSQVPDKEAVTRQISEILTNGEVRSFPEYEASLYGIIRSQGRVGTLAIASEGVLLTKRNAIYFWVLTKSDDLWLQDSEGRISVVAKEW